jgi:hypothetical protein
VSYLLIPLFILLAILIAFGIFVFLARFKNGRYLRPIILWLSKIPWLKKQFEKISQAAIEKQNPELASAMRKIQRLGPNPDPQRAQQALSQLSASERRAYMDAVAMQGAMPEPSNREQRRRQQRLTQGPQPQQQPKKSSGGSAKSSGGSTGTSSSRRKKR